jgi:hypothetical protein
MGSRLTSTFLHMRVVDLVTPNPILGTSTTGCTRDGILFVLGVTHCTPGTTVRD